MSENLEIIYNIKAMFTDAYKNPQFNAYANGAINTLLGKALKITKFAYNNYINRFFEVVVIGDEIPVVVVGKIKTALNQFVYSCTNNEEISQILHMINADTYNDFYKLAQDQAELFKLTNYMYSVLFMGNVSEGHLFRIMM